MWEADGSAGLPDLGNHVVERWLDQYHLARRTGFLEELRAVATRPEVIPALAVHRQGISDALADAFFDDPVMSFLLPDPKSRRRRLARLFGVLLRIHYLPLRSVWTTSELEGAAMWAPPGRAIIPLLVILRNSPAMLSALGAHALRALRVLTHVEQVHPREPHW